MVGHWKSLEHPELTGVPLSEPASKSNEASSETWQGPVSGVDSHVPVSGLHSTELHGAWRQGFESVGSHGEPTS